MLNPNNCARTTCLDSARYCIKTSPPRRHLLCLHSTNYNGPTKEGVEVGGNRKGPIMGLINFITDKQHKQLRFYGWG